MKTLARNKQAIFYALYLGKTEILDENGYFTGEYVKSFAEPVELKINVSPTKGTSDIELFGIETQYSKVMVTSDMNCPINEFSRLWIGIPKTDPHNYVVVRVAKGLNSISYAIQEVSVS